MLHSSFPYYRGMLWIDNLLCIYNSRLFLGCSPVIQSFVHVAARTLHNLLGTQGDEKGCCSGDDNLVGVETSWIWISRRLVLPLLLALSSIVVIWLFCLLKLRYLPSAANSHQSRLIDPRVTISVLDSELGGYLKLCIWRLVSETCNSVPISMS